MAKQTVTTFVDDFDGSEAQGTVEFSLDGKSYEIDLSEHNTTKLHEVLAPYVEKARKAAAAVKARSGRKSSARPASGTDRERNQAIREFAQARGIKVNPRGRLSREAIDAYEAEHGAAPVAEAPAAPVEVADVGTGSLQPEFTNA